MPTSNKKDDKYSRQIEEVLAKEYKPRHPKAQIKAYRYNSASVRVRVLDPDFAGKTIPEREDMVWAILDSLPERVRAEITVLLLLTPEERETSLLSAEFDAPTRSAL
jgi:stress-induced morphogen